MKIAAWIILFFYISPDAKCGVTWNCHPALSNPIEYFISEDYTPTNITLDFEKWKAFDLKFETPIYSDFGKGVFERYCIWNNEEEKSMRCYIHNYDRYDMSEFFWFSISELEILDETPNAIRLKYTPDKGTMHVYVPESNMLKRQYPKERGKPDYELLTEYEREYYCTKVKN